MQLMEKVRGKGEGCSWFESRTCCKSNCEQVELIGDCYFAATGGTAGDGTQADIAARLGVAMISAVGDVAEAYGVELQVQAISFLVQCYYSRTPKFP